MRGYLSQKGHGTDLLETLFSGMVERVVALVSRIEGTYEFEVQPMREYFAARYLYDTAPYSPAGVELPGTLPERFEALAADLFWQNVTRFYAGCHNQGELPSILTSLRFLSTISRYKGSCYLQSLAVSLLADYAFAQYPLISKEVLDVVLDGTDFRVLLVSERHPPRAESLYFPKGNGSERLVAQCIDELLRFPESAYAHVLIETIRRNSDLNERAGLWWSALRSVNEAESRTEWLSYGLGLGVVQVADGSRVEALSTESDQEYGRRMTRLAFGGMWSFVAQHDRQIGAVVDEVLSRDNQGLVYRKREAIQEFAVALSIRRYWIAFREPSRGSLTRIWDRYWMVEESKDTKEVVAVGECDILLRCRALVETSKELADSFSVDVWASDLGPWTKLIERGRDLFGDRWALYVLASLAAGVPSKEEQSDNASDLFDVDVPIVPRARYARLRAGQWRWWKEHLRKAEGDEQLAFFLLMLFRWAGRSSVVRMKEEIEEKLRGLTDEWWGRLLGSLQSLGMLSDRRRTVCASGRELGDNVSERFAAAIWWRTSEKGREFMFRRFLNRYKGRDNTVSGFCQDTALEAATRGKWGAWQDLLPGIAERHRMGVGSNGTWYHRWRFFTQQDGMALEVAERVVDDSDAYPIVLSAWAERVCRTGGPLGDIIPVGKVAERKGWFRGV